MEFNTFVLVEEINGAEIWECRTVDWPVGEILELEAVDVDSARRALQRDMDEKVVPLSPPAVNPLIPVQFEYRTTSNDQQRTVNGIVMADDVGPLVQFAEQNLSHVDGDSVLNGFQAPESEAIWPTDQRRSRLISKLESISERNNDLPYSCYPLVYRPLEDRRNYSRNREATLEMHIKKQGGSKLMFISGHCWDYFQKSSITTNLRQIDDDRQTRRDRNRYSPESYEPVYYVPKNSWDEGKQQPSSDRVLPQFPRNNRQVESYIWTSNGEQGVVSRSKNLPVGLLSRLDGNGLQIEHSQQLRSPFPLSFFKPRYIVSSGWDSLEQHRESIIERDEFELNVDEQVLNSRWYVRSLHEPLDFSIQDDGKKSFNPDKNNENDMDDSFPLVQNEKGLAYILQRTKNGIYDPEHGPRPFDLPERKGWKPAYTLCEVDLSETKHSSRKPTG